jgi:bile acid-coenzyme A ligase
MTSDDAGTGAEQAVATRLAALAAERGDTTALIVVSPEGQETETSWRELARAMTDAACLLYEKGVRAGDLVAIALPKCAGHFAATFGAWYLGARPLTLNPDVPEAERRRLIDLARPALIVSGPAWEDGGSAALVVEPGSRWPAERHSHAAEELPEPPLSASFAIASGGSSGRPKIILSPFPGPFVVADRPPDEHLTGRTADMVQLVNGPLYHNSPCTLAYGGLLWGHQLVVMQRFDAELALDLIERHRVSFIPTVPTVMNRMLVAQAAHPRDLISIKALFHTGASCPPAIKLGWIELIGGERVYEAFGGSELTGSTFIRGDEWLSHPGSVGRPVGADMVILDDHGVPVPPGEVGEIYMRTHRPGAAYSYLNQPSPGRRPDGYESLGDLGWLSSDGYLYIADRRVDLIITGGENVYPAEVENVLIEHPKVRDAVVVGIPDPQWGKRVHAVVCRSDAALSAGELRDFCRGQLASYKVPKTIEFAEILPRDPESGKIRRSGLVERISQAEAASPGAPV